MKSGRFSIFFPLNQPVETLFKAMCSISGVDDGKTVQDFAKWVCPEMVQTQKIVIDA